MPKAKKLHSKGKSIAIQKNCNLEEDGNETNTNDSIREFELQLCWCISQLERTLVSKKGTEKQLQDAWKTVTILKSNNQPMIRKRQLMRTTFGDYRALMAAEEKKLTKMASKMKISDSPIKPKATFLRKSALLTNGDTSFKFNFNIQESKDEENNGNRTEDKSPPSATIIKKVEVKPTDINFKSSSSEFKFNFSIDNNA